MQVKQQVFQYYQKISHRMLRQLNITYTLNVILSDTQTLQTY